MIDWKNKKNELRLVVENSYSFAEVALQFGIISKGGNTATIKRWVKEFDIDTSHFHRKRVSAKTFPSFDEIFKENSTIDRNYAKQCILRHEIFKYECRKCGCDGTWQDEKLTLHIEHKNGVNNDHRLTNLEFLCPNCHSQTSTFGGKNSHKRNEVSINVKLLEEKSIQKMQILEEVKNKILNSGINFNKCGWPGKVADILNMTPQKAKPWIRRNMPDFFATCYTKKF